VLDASFYTYVTREGFVSFFTSVILSLKSGGGGSVESSLTSPNVKLLEFVSSPSTVRSRVRFHRVAKIHPFYIQSKNRELFLDLISISSPLWRLGPTRARVSSFLRFSRSHTTTHHSR